METSPPPGTGGSANGAPDQTIGEIDDFLARLLTGEVRVTVDPASGKIVEVRENLPLDSRAEEA